MFVIKHKKIFISISILLIFLSVLFLSVFGLNVGIDFKGGALTEVIYKTDRPTQAVLSQSLEALNFGVILLQPTRSKDSQGRPEQDEGTTGDFGYIVKSRSLNDSEHAQLLKTLSLDGLNSLIEINFNSIGPSVGRELARKAVTAVILVSLAIIGFIAFAFRKVSYSHIPGRRGVASWKYGLIAVIALLHDVIIPIGLFIILSRYCGAELDALFVVAVLTIIGLSVSDTIVIFDRIRENLKNEALTAKTAKISFSEVVGKSLNQSYVRSICTSLTVILVLLALFFFGPATTKYFSLMLAAGMFFGTYSSIFLASPLLVLAEKWQKEK